MVQEIAEELHAEFVELEARSKEIQEAREAAVTQRQGVQREQAEAKEHEFEASRAFTQELQAVRAKLEKRETELLDLHAQDNLDRQRLQRARRSCEAEHDKLTTELNEALHDVDCFPEEKNKLRKQNNASKEECQLLREDVQRLEEKNSEWHSYRKVIRHLERRSTVENEELITVRNRAQSFGDELSEQRKRLLEVQEDHEEKEAECEAVEAEVEAAGAENELLAQQRDHDVTGLEEVTAVLKGVGRSRGVSSSPFSRQGSKLQRESFSSDNLVTKDSSGTTNSRPRRLSNPSVTTAEQDWKRAQTAPAHSLESALYQVCQAARVQEKEALEKVLKIQTQLTDLSRDLSTQPKVSSSWEADSKARSNSDSLNRIGQQLDALIALIVAVPDSLPASPESERPPTTAAEQSYQEELQTNRQLLHVAQMEMSEMHAEATSQLIDLQRPRRHERKEMQRKIDDLRAQLSRLKRQKAMEAELRAQLMQRDGEMEGLRRSTERMAEVRVQLMREVANLRRSFENQVQELMRERAEEVELTSQLAYSAAQRPSGSSHGSVHSAQVSPR